MRKGQTKARMLTIVHDGELTEEEALEALAEAAQAATEALPDAFARCQTDEQRRKVQTDRDVVVMAYLSSLRKSLIQTSAHFERTAEDLKDAANDVRQMASGLKNVTEAINLFTGLVRLAASLALAFG